MSDLRKAAEMALEDICGAKLCEINSMSSRVEMLRLMNKAADTLRQALAQPEQEPVAWLNDREEMYFDKEDAFRNSDGFIQPLYAEPPKREWVGLTDEEVFLISEYPECCQVSIRNAEVKLKEKNT